MSSPHRHPKGSRVALLDSQGPVQPLGDILDHDAKLVATSFHECDRCKDSRCSCGRCDQGVCGPHGAGRRMMNVQKEMALGSMERSQTVRSGTQGAGNLRVPWPHNCTCFGE